MSPRTLVDRVTYSGTIAYSDCAIWSTAGHSWHLTAANLFLFPLTAVRLEDGPDRLFVRPESCSLRPTLAWIGRMQTSRRGLEVGIVAKAIVPPEYGAPAPCAVE